MDTTTDRPRYVSVTDTAKEIRAALKAAFPGVKFSVRSDKYAGGASIRVYYTDGPALRAVEDVAKQFAGATFDGMIDLKEYHTSQHNGEVVHWGADFVFVNQDFSPEVTAQAEEFTRLALAEEGVESHRGWYGGTPQAFLRARKDDDWFGWESNWHSLVRLASIWITEGRTLIVREV